MRVITGTARGRKLLEPSGMDIRPTADVVKEAVFNIIQFDIEGRRVLDLFAGTGQLGIEALSRGAAECVFVDESAKAVKLVRENLSRCKLQGRVMQVDALACLSRGEKYDIIFLDPPYDTTLLDKCLEIVQNVDISVSYTHLPAAGRPAGAEEKQGRQELPPRQIRRGRDGSDRCRTEINPPLRPCPCCCK